MSKSESNSSAGKCGCTLLLLWLSDLQTINDVVDYLYELFIVTVILSEFNLKFKKKQLNRPSVLWCCWLGSRKGIRPVKTEWWGNGVVLSGARCKWFAYGPTDAIATSSFLAPVKSRMVSFWCRITQVVLEKRPLNGCSSSSNLKLKRNCWPVYYVTLWIFKTDFYLLYTFLLWHTNTELHV